MQELHKILGLGDTIYHFTQGIGKVTEVRGGESPHIGVNHPGDHLYFYYPEHYRYISADPWPDPAPFCSYGHDEIILVSNNGVTWKKRHFKRLVKGGVVCYGSGASSITADTDAQQTQWKYHKKL